jgi:hypothetical protein
MLRFIAGILACLLVQAVGRPRIEAWFDTASRASTRAYHAAQSEVTSRTGDK